MNESSREDKPTEKEELSAKQASAITALLHEPTLEKAAVRVGVSESTLIRWQKEPEFAATYREAKREVVNHAVTQLQSACGEAVKTLLDVAKDGAAPASSRVSAARAILDTSMRAIEIDDLAARIELLEKTLEDKNNASH